jgi:type IV secretory pathway VirB2 component (pilin)
MIGLVITGVMFLFSAWMYQRTGDWVAAVFALGSLGYGLFFWSRGEDSSS